MTTSRAAKVSVIVPTRNRAAMLPAAVRSILEHAASVPFELVVVDNGSTDETAEVASRLADEDARVRTLREPTIGRAAAMNAGIEAAEADVLVFTDDDVTVEDGWLDAWWSFFHRHPGPVLGGGTILPVPRDGEWPAWFSQRAMVSLGWRRWSDERVLGDVDGAWGANMAARRETFERFGAWREDVGVRDTAHPREHEPEESEDTELQVRVRAAGGQVWSCPEAVVRHRVARPHVRDMLSKAFANGRNTRLRGPNPWTWPGDRTRAGAVGSWIAWACAATRSLVWSPFLRARPTQEAFERAWSALWQLGWRMDDLLGTRRGGPRADRVVRRMTRRVQRLALRLAPERS